MAIVSLGTNPVIVRADVIMRSGDSFDLRLGGVPGDEASAFNNTYTIDGEGNLNLPLLGKLNVSGQTPSRIQSTIEQAYVSRQIYTHPTVTLVTSGARFVNVSGAVKSPQRVNWTPDMTVMMAINAAGDFNDFANQGKVILTHGGKVQEVNCKAIRKRPELDVKVEPGDQITVRESFF